MKTCKALLLIQGPGALLNHVWECYTPAPRGLGRCSVDQPCSFAHKCGPHPPLESLLEYPTGSVSPSPPPSLLSFTVFTAPDLKEKVPIFWIGQLCLCVDPGCPSSEQ